MPMTDIEITDVARTLAKKIFVVTNDTAHSSLSELMDAVEAIDQAMNATTTQLSAVRPGEVLKVALLDHIRDAASKFSIAQAGIALVLWVAKEVGFDDFS